MALVGFAARFLTVPTNNFSSKLAQNDHAQLGRQWFQRKQGTHRYSAALEAVSQLRAGLQRGDRAAVDASPGGLLAVGTSREEASEPVLRHARGAACHAGRLFTSPSGYH